MKHSVQVRSRSKWAKYGAGGSLILVLGMLTWSQSHMYADMGTLWRNTIADNPNSAMAYNNLGMLLLQQNRNDEGLMDLKTAVRLDPENAEAQSNLGDAFRRGHAIFSAIEHFKKAVELDPGNASFHANLGNADTEAGLIRDAVNQYEPAVRLAPSDAIIANNYAWLLATSPDASIRNGQKAVELAELAVHFSGGSQPVILGTLAAAFAEAGRFDDAVAAGEKSVSLASAANNKQMAEWNEKLLELYRAGHPYHGE